MDNESELRKFVPQGFTVPKRMDINEKGTCQLYEGFCDGRRCALVSGAKNQAKGSFSYAGPEEWVHFKRRTIRQAFEGNCAIKDYVEELIDQLPS